MRRVICLLCVTLCIAISVRAGNQFEISVLGGPSFPMRGMEKLVGPGYRVGGTIQYNLNENIGLAITSGYMRWKFDSGKINGAAAAAGVAQGFDVRGPFQSIPLMLGARLTFDGSVVRPYIGIMGGAFFLQWTLTGTHAGGSPAAIPTHGVTWTEPATSFDAGLLVGLGGDAWLDLGGSYTAFSNSHDRIESPQLAGQKLVTSNTATQIAVQVGIRLIL
jgi:hypothetical protein